MSDLSPQCASKRTSCSLVMSIRPVTWLNAKSPGFPDHVSDDCDGGDEGSQIRCVGLKVKVFKNYRDHFGLPV
jgi:hypothetical protein